MSSLELRIRELERGSRQIKLVGGALAMLLSAFIFLGLTTSPPQTIEAHKFVLKDSAGHDRAVLSITEDEKNAHFRLIDAAGNAHFFVGSGPSGALIWMTDGPGKLRISASASEEPSVALSDKNALPVLSLKVPEAGHAVIELGETVQLIGSKSNGNMTLYGADGFPRGVFSVPEAGETAYIQILDSQGRTVATLPAIR